MFRNKFKMNKKGGKQANLHDDVKALRQEVAKKRMGEKVTATKFLAVTRCATEPVGGLKKFPRITSIETIESDTSLEGIKQACAKFWAQEGKGCGDEKW